MNKKQILRRGDRKMLTWMKCVKRRSKCRTLHMSNKLLENNSDKIKLSNGTIIFRRELDLDE